ncbi:MAG: M20/M25/M40 family metallo-hydrolase [Deltaproteobacteria bacterium]|nr:M20/M25/M40 family metallo-hydrolase [Deltaproteobacteria bacterium]
MLPSLLLALATAHAAPVHHALQVTLHPASHTLEVVDEVLLGEERCFTLHAGLSPSVSGEGWSLAPAEEQAPEGRVPLERWCLSAEQGATAAPVLSYGGALHHPLEQAGEEYQRGFSETPGSVEEQGVLLSGSSRWVPWFDDALITFDLEVRGLEAPWSAVSQGGRTLAMTDAGQVVRWSSPTPTEEVYLVAGPWHEYSARAGKTEVFAFLRTEDPALAQRYLDATRRYLEMYEGLLPPYPYPSFSLVENYWETGYGMPGFTLLGSEVIRFPWILTSSYPHELLHNWWGNSVYVDLEQGNWCEGMTVYLADHLLREQRGEGATYRRDTLKRYTDFASAASDFPLSAFGARSSAVSEAVGYGKGAMLVHMLREELGDEVFLASVRRFYLDNAMRRATWSDLAAAIQAESGWDAWAFMQPWLERPGAPKLTLGKVRSRALAGGEWSLHLDLRQGAEPFPLTVPVAVTVEGQQAPVWARIPLQGERARVDLPLPGRPLRVDVDPTYDVMRRLDPLETAPTLSTLSGHDDAIFVLPSRASEEEQAAWRALAEAWARPSAPTVALDRDLRALPPGSAWILGRQNLLAPAALATLPPEAVVDGAPLIDGAPADPTARSLVLVGRHPAAPAQAVAWVSAAQVEAIAGLARKLPHYGRYAYLGFAGPEPQNDAKGVFAALSSPLVRDLTGEGAALHLAEEVPLIDLPPAFDGSAMARTVAALSAPEMEGRGLGSEGLERATALVEARLSALGLEPAGDQGYRQRWSWTGGDPERELPLTNLVARLPGADPTLPPVVVMAHLDHLGLGWPDVRQGNEGQVHPGADDNASGVSALLAVAEAMAEEPPRPRALIFAVTTGEEAGLLGSRHLLEGMAGGLPMSCVNLDSVGRLGAGKLMVLGAASARELPHVFMGVGFTTGAPIAMVSEPLDSSDQIACIERGVPGVQLFTGPHPEYHTPADTSDRIDADGLAVVAESTHIALDYLAGRVEPLTSAGAPQAHPGPPGATRKVGLGTMPDFTYQGPGVRVQQVMEGSGAHAAGLQAGDVLLALGGAEVGGLRQLSTLLAEHVAGDQITVTIQRGEERIELPVTLQER